MREWHSLVKSRLSNGRFLVSLEFKHQIKVFAVSIDESVNCRNSNDQSHAKRQSEGTESGDRHETTTVNNSVCTQIF